MRITAMPVTIMMSKQKLLMRVSKKLFVYCFCSTLPLLSSFKISLATTASSTPKRKFKPKIVERRFSPTNEPINAIRP